MGMDESAVESAALAWLAGAGWPVRNGAQIAPGEPAAERDDYGQATTNRAIDQFVGLSVLRTVSVQARIPISTLPGCLGGRGAATRAQITVPVQFR